MFSFRFSLSLSAAGIQAAMAEEEPEKPKEMIKLVSKEGHEFSVEKQAAMVSNTIKSMLTGPGMFTENESDTINFPEISKEVLEEVRVTLREPLSHPTRAPVSKEELGSLIVVPVPAGD